MSIVVYNNENSRSFTSIKVLEGMKSSIEDMDNHFAEIAQRSGSIQNLFHDFFGFLHRRTDFYVEIPPSTSVEEDRKFNMGFPTGMAEKILLEAFHKYPFKNYEEVTNQKGKPSPSPAPTAISKEPKIEAPSSSTKSETLTQPKIVLTDTGKQIPIGNGGIGPNYFWTQSLKDLTIYIDIPTGIKSKEIQCAIKSKSMKLLIPSLSSNALLEGEFEDPINAADSMWTLNQGKSKVDVPQIVITLEKTRETWWKSVIIGHPEIDTTKVTPIFKVLK